MMLRFWILTACCLWTSASFVHAQTEYPGAIADLRIARGSKGLAEVWLADPTTRYRHFVLGSQYEAASVVARMSDGRIVKLTLDDQSVFEDRQPRLADIDGDGRDDIILVRSYRDRGAALAVVGLRGGQLVIVAETPPTGSPNTWLNPAGIADFDGDGTIDIAYVQMPHILGLLRVWTWRAGALVEIGTLPDVSNHIAGSPALGLAAVADFNGDGVADLAIPSKNRMALRFLTFRRGIRELGRVALPAPALEDFKMDRRHGPPAVEVGLGKGKSVRVAAP